MRLVTISDIEAAAATFGDAVLHTPLLPWRDGRLWLKPECLQPIGAFKIRGAYNALSLVPADVRARGVVAYSSGNHAQAVAYVAKLFGVPATIVVPDNTPQVKIDATRSHGAVVKLVPMAQRESAAEAIAAAEGLTLIPPFDHRDVIAGQGTIGLEIVADMPDVEVVVVPISGGGLISGIGTAVKALRPSVRVIGVEPELASETSIGFRSKTLVHWSADDRARTVADALRGQPSELTFAHILSVVDDVVTVSEEEMLDTVGLLARRSRLVAEPGGAAAVAAYLNRGLPEGKTVAVVSGGNIDPALLARVLAG
ncbi:threonine/serine dehydratase [Lentzea tibetensis]|uniref:threonine ammonia-lyase n=1 Tax=Lentzea tibetensis TaxID=2591470 RepID=A0A563ETP4_9PSEU|nr:threonine/serine dehydratase [Lentzea tibetensis]TWP51097.1 threonine/serine dehydratase [Lentzea tibetensis]